MPDKAQEETGVAPEEETKPQDMIVQTQHQVTIGGQRIPYTATAGTIILKEEMEEAKKESEGAKAKASMFFVAYTKDPDEGMEENEQRRQRPITFSFNGGPGSSSVWLHLGLLGPRRVDVTDEQDRPLQPPFHLVDNEYSLLDLTDLVFIDPVSTGYSRVIPGEKPQQFHDFTKDIESVADFIRLYTSRYQRWASPKFLIGESYGTTRAAGLSGHLQDRHGMYLNGIMLISAILNFQTARFVAGNDLPYPLFLPTYAATAWYHGRLDQDLQRDLKQTLKKVEEFAQNDYVLALMQGDRLSGTARAEIVARLSRYTGLSEDYVEQTNLRINIHRFVKELLREDRKTVGRLDSRFTASDRDAAGEFHEFDPSYPVIQGPYTATLNDYVRSELDFKCDLPYEILTHRVRPWSFDKHQNEYVNVAETLRSAMSKNPFLQVFVANGYFDLATPYFATHYTFNHLEIEPGLRENIEMAHYEAGHMMYVHRPSLVQQKEDLARFVRRAST
jgi:carboxypeptidase C (cathepsin A)